MTNCSATTPVIFFTSLALIQPACGRRMLVYARVGEWVCTHTVSPVYVAYCKNAYTQPIARTRTRPPLHTLSLLYTHMHTIYYAHVHITYIVYVCLQCTHTHSLMYAQPTVPTCTQSTMHTYTQSTLRTYAQPTVPTYTLTSIRSLLRTHNYTQPTIHTYTNTDTLSGIIKQRKDADMCVVLVCVFIHENEFNTR